MLFRFAKRLFSEIHKPVIFTGTVCQKAKKAATFVATFL